MATITGALALVLGWIEGGSVEFAPRSAPIDNRRDNLHMCWCVCTERYQEFSVFEGSDAMDIAILRFDKEVAT